MGLKDSATQWGITQTEEIANAMASFGSSIADSVRTGLESLISAASSSAVFGVLQGVGCSILTCMFLIHLGESALKDKNDPDGLIKDIALLGLYSILMGNLPGILSALSVIIQGILGWLGSASVGFDQNASWVVDMADSFDQSSILTVIFTVAIFAVLGNIAMIVIKMIAYISIYTAKIELFVRTLLFPIAIGFIAEDGWRGPGGRYIKKWCACYLQLGIISVILHGYVFVLTLCMGAGQGSELIAILAGGFAAAGLCMKSSQLSNDVLGV